MTKLYEDVFQIKHAWLSMTMDQISAEFIIELFKEDISDILRKRFPSSKGFSVTSIKRFCKKNCISSRVSKEYLGEIVSKAVDEVTLLRLLILLNPCIYMLLEERHTALQAESDRKLFVLCL